MTLPILLLLVTVLVGLVFFSLEIIPSDVTALGILLFLIITRLLPAERAFAGFGSDAVLMILGILVMVEALTRTGVTDFVGRMILRQTDTSASKILLVVMIAAAVMAAFISNTAATAFFLPIVIGLALRARLSPAKFLMPLAFASVLSSSVTLISTSTNVIVSSLITKYDMPPMGMFELTLVGVPIAIVGVAYMLTLGRRLVPDRMPSQETQVLSAHLFLAEIPILSGSPLIEKTLKEAALGRAPRDLDVYEMTLRGISQHQITEKATRACRRDLEEAVRRDPNYAPAWTYLAWVNLIDLWVDLTGELHRGDLDAVIEQFARAIELDPKLPNAFRGFGQAMVLKGDIPQALILSKRAFELGPSEPDSFLFLALALYANGDLTEATTLVERALELHPLPPSYYSYFHAVICWANEDYEEALREADASLRKAPEIVDAEVYRTLALVGLGRIEEAKAQIATYRERQASTFEVPQSPELASRFISDLHAAGWRPTFAGSRVAS